MRRHSLVSAVLSRKTEKDSKMAEEQHNISILFSELRRYIEEVVMALQQSGSYSNDFIQFRLDWLCNTVIRYVSQIPFGDSLLHFIQTARDLVQQENNDRPVFYETQLSFTGQRGRPRLHISRDQMGFFLDLHFTASEIASLMGVSESTVRRSIHEYDCHVERSYSDFTEEQLDQVVLQFIREFPNCGYRRMTGLLLSRGHRVQQHRIRESMRRVDPRGVLLRAIEIRTIRRRKYQVPGPLALWHIDGNHKLIRYITLNSHFLFSLITYTVSYYAIRIKNNSIT